MTHDPCPGEGANLFLRSMLPEGGLAVHFVKAVIDESKPTPQTPLLCVGGYTFESNALIDFNFRWSADLKKENVEYFHRADLLGPRGKMKHLTQAAADGLQDRLIDLIRELSLFGFAVVLAQSEYEESMAGYVLIKDDGSEGPFPTAYAFACFACLLIVRRWGERDGFRGEVSYVFEDGHEEEIASRFIGEHIRDKPHKHQLFRYGGHAFRPKQCEPGLQAADLLAWHTAKMYKNREGGWDQRPDFLRLFSDRGDRDRILHYQRKHIDELRDELVRAGHLKKV